MKPCPECNAGMLPADTIDCEKANFVCRECAPDFVLANVSSFSTVSDPLDARGEDASNRL